MDLMERMHYVMVLMMGHYPIEPVDVAFIFGRAQGDFEAEDGDSGILQLAAKLFYSRLVRYISYPGNEGGQTFQGATVTTTYPGAAEYSEHLHKLGVSRHQQIPTAPAVLHTRGECDAFVTLAKNHHWNTGVVIMQPHQMLRAMLSLVQSLKEHCYTMRLRPICPPSVNWEKPVYGSQGELQVNRRQHIDAEWERIQRYWDQGSLACLDELALYLQDLA